MTDIVPEEEVFESLSDVLRLSKLHDLDYFDCGVESCNEWLKKYGISSLSSGDAQVYIVCRGRRVVGYYTLNTSKIAVAEATVRAGKGLPRVGNVSTILIGQLAVDVREQGKNIGAFLLQNALRRCVVLSRGVGVRAVMVHAIDERAKSFYQKFDFEESPVQNLTMLLLMKDIKSALGMVSR